MRALASQELAAWSGHCYGWSGRYRLTAVVRGISVPMCACLEDGQVRPLVTQLKCQLTLELLGRGLPAGYASPLPKVTEWVPTGAADVGTRAAIFAPCQCEAVGFASPRRPTAVL